MSENIHWNSNKWLKESQEQVGLHRLVGLFSVEQAMISKHDWTHLSPTAHMVRTASLYLVTPRSIELSNYKLDIEI